ncbi:hypothetical protein PMIN01_12295 [Paraphaeosphaeria minitans]|uniref:Uncharacterized protein n=1 Tax=Paraphaeosphaeria minitans TaxID=565426 RepID=A0A9P6KKB6_9PLEO|nr:hypothetical protein PMIN01_12295 [Paraphaeosphaeria minitans]
MLFHNSKAWKERLFHCSSTLFDLCYARYLVMDLKTSRFPESVSAKHTAQAEIVFKEFTRVCGLLAIDLHRTDDVTGLTQSAIPEHKNLQEEKGSHEWAIADSKVGFFWTLLHGRWLRVSQGATIRPHQVRDEEMSSHLTC